MVEQCELEYEWIGMQQKGRMQAALRITSVGNCGNAMEDAKALMPRGGIVPLPSTSLEKAETETHPAAKSIPSALTTALQRLEDLKASLASLEKNTMSCTIDVGDRCEDQEGLRAALIVQCESLTKATAALRHRQQQQSAHSITSCSTLSTCAVPTNEDAVLEKCVEGDAMMAMGDFAAAAVHYGRSAADAGSPSACAAFKQLQREALLKAKEQKKSQKRKEQRKSQTERKQRQMAVASLPRPRRSLPESLAKGNCRFNVRITPSMAQALAQELLEIPGLGQSAEECDEAAVRTSLESYQITEQMKRMQLRSVMPQQCTLLRMVFTENFLPD